MSTSTTAENAVAALADDLARETYESAEEVLRLYRPVLRALATAAGPTVEVVLHNLDGTDVDLGHTIMAIENGHVTGRAVGGPSTSLGLDVLKDRRGTTTPSATPATPATGGNCAVPRSTSTMAPATSSRRCA